LQEKLDKQKKADKVRLPVTSVVEDVGRVVVNLLVTFTLLHTEIASHCTSGIDCICHFYFKNIFMLASFIELLAVLATRI